MKPLISYSLRKSVQSLRGFTLIELMVTIAVMGILATLAAPALSTFVSRNTIRSISNDFNQGLQRTRSEAINGNECTVICKSSTHATASPRCLATGAEWGTGWIAFRSTSCAVPTASIPSADVFLRREGFDERYVLISVPSTPAIVFNSRGVSTLSSAGEFNLQDMKAPANDARFKRSFCLDGVGRVRVTEFEKC